MSAIGTKRTFAALQQFVRFSNRPFEVKRFQAIHHCSVDVAHGLVLLFGIGTKALPVWDSKTRRNNLLGGLTVRVTAGSSDITNSPHPSSRGASFHRLVELEFSPIACDPVRFLYCCRGLFPGPAELGAINPYAVHDYGEPACQRHDCLFLPTAPGDLHRPGLEP